jgi:hypothetical protein
VAKLKTAKNLLQKRDEYSRYYGDFRGVDFSSDHTQVHDQRLAYSVNMFKDYQSGQGKAIETIPGFRRRAVLEGGEIHGIHSFGENVFVHCGTNLYRWDIAKHPYVNVSVMTSVTLPEKSDEYGGIREFRLDGFEKVNGVYDIQNKPLGFEYASGTIIISSSVLKEGDTVRVDASFSPSLLDEGMAERRSQSFTVGNDGYIIDGSRLLFKKGSDSDTFINITDGDVYIPTTYTNLRPSDTAEDVINKQKNQLNFLQPLFRNTFVADGETKKFYLMDKFDTIEEVKLYDETVEGYEVNAEEGYITFTEAPGKPEDNNRPAGYAGIEITARKDYGLQSQITGCTLYALFDGRVFFSGNPLSPNTLYWCSLNPDTALPDVTYWGMYDHIQIGQENNAPITGLVPVANTLMVLKGDSKSDGSVYYVTPEATGDDIYPVVYVSQSGLNGIGCLGASCNFLDDPVFVSRLGLEGVGQLSTRLERAIEHRSSLVDAKLCNEDLKNASLVEWNGYLVLLVNGNIYLADSRQRYTHEIGTMQYEWYYLEDIGIYSNMSDEYKYSTYTKFANGLTGDVTIDNTVRKMTIRLADKVKDPILGVEVDMTGKIVSYVEHVYNAKVEGDESEYKVVINRNVAYLVEPTGALTYTLNSKFYPAVTIESIEGNIFFGTSNGVVCSFNFDQRGTNGTIPSQLYNFDGRAIRCGVATKMDNCGVPHLVKNTVKKSTVVKTKTFQTSAAKIKVRTNNKPYDQIARITSTVFSFENMDFTDLSFDTKEQSLFSVREKEKRWVEKQYYIYSDEIGKPFALFYIAYRYNIAGRYKE